MTMRAPTLAAIVTVVGVTANAREGGFSPAWMPMLKSRVVARFHCARCRAGKLSMAETSRRIAVSGLQGNEPGTKRLRQGRKILP